MALVGSLSWRIYTFHTVMTPLCESSNNKRSRLQNMALFLASPFVGLYYAVLLPGKLIQLAMAERKQSQAHSDDSK